MKNMMTLMTLLFSLSSFAQTPPTLQPGCYESEYKEVMEIQDTGDVETIQAISDAGINDYLYSPEDKYFFDLGVGLIFKITVLEGGKSFTYQVSDETPETYTFKSEGSCKE
ncbi:hypothetical protein N9N67_05315 [Bacteriovoracaceae bacterium]|nr:hypothetical protein [Bacteriovoracaceae bacterium]